MAKQSINVGSSANDRSGDSLRLAFQKVNANFTELYTALGLDTAPLNLGAFEFSGSTLSTTDSSAITIDQATTISSNLTVGGDLLPSIANGGDLGSAAKPWKSLYVSGSTIYIGGNTLGLDNEGNLAWNGSTVAHADGEFIRLDALTDVNAPSPNAGDTLAWMGSQYVNVPLREDRLHSEGDEVVLVGGANPYVTFPAITGGDQLIIQGAEVSTVSGSLALTSQDNLNIIANGSGAAPGGSKNWTFGDDGSLTIPGDIRSEQAINIDINLSDSTLRRWTFGEDGDLNIPGDVVRNGSPGLTLGASHSVYIVGDRGDNDRTWTFDGSSGDLLLPNGAELGDDGNDVGNTELRVPAGGAPKVWSFDIDGNLTVPGNLQSNGNINIEINLADSTKRIWQFGEDGNFVIPGDITFPDATVQSTAALTYTNFGDSGVRTDGGTGNNFWKPTFADGTGTINKAGVYKTANNANNSLFTFGANGAGTMSVVMDGSLFVGSSLPSNNGGLNTNYGGWLVVQAGAKFGGDLNTIGNFILDTPGNYVRFGDGTTQTTAADFGYLDLDKDTIKGTAGYQYTFATDGYFTSSTSSESTNYFFVAYNTTNANIAAGWTVVGGTANTTVSSVTYPVAGYPGVIRVNLTAAASSTSGFYPVTVTSPDRLRVEIQPDPGTSDKFAFTTSGITFPNGAQILKTAGVDDSITIGATGTPGTTTFNGSGFFNSDTFFHRSIQEKFSSLQDATGVVTHNCENGHVFYHTSPDANWTVNLTNFSLITNYATAITIIISQGGTGYYPNALQIGGAAQTINWQGNATPTPSSNRVDVVTFSIFLTGGGYTVLGQLTGF